MTKQEKTILTLKEQRVVCCEETEKDLYTFAIECIEKQIPKKTNVNEKGQRWCPHCVDNNIRQMVGGWEYCPNCGQRLE